MNLRTELKLPEYNFKLDYNTKILTIGSCFSEVIGGSLLESKFNVVNNPFGTVFNINSISNLIINATSNVTPREDWFYQREDIYFHHLYHSSVNSYSREELLTKIVSENLFVGDFLKQADLLIITIGTSWVYSLNEQVVSNCHKRDPNDFTKGLLSLEEQKDILYSLIRSLNIINPKLKVLLTVSPVRHIKDGIQENSISKAILRILIHDAVETFDNLYYYPSYEIMMDDLRDYRFYNSDLIHPNELAENYIIDIFKRSFLSKDTFEDQSKWSKIKVAIEHRPFNPKSLSHQVFLKNLKDKIKTFESYFEVSSELKWVTKQILRT